MCTKFEKCSGSRGKRQDILGAMKSLRKALSLLTATATVDNDTHNCNNVVYIYSSVI